MLRLRFVVLGISALAGLPAFTAPPADPAMFAGLRWRMVGPFRGGRTVTATGVPGKPDRFYFGAVGGGVWRSDNAGRTWEPILDGQPVASIGAVAVAPSNPDVVYVGSGEADMRSDIGYGNGVYRSSDGGATWTPVGLAGTRHVGRIVVDPRDPNLVFVAALGHAYGPNPERGVYRSKDGGKTWARVLYRDASTGAVDLALDPGDPRTILAALWQTRRPPWNVYPPSSGPGSGLYRSTDGGDTWTPVTAGLPSEKLGRIGIAFAPSKPERVYAIVDAKRGGLYVSEDRGSTWRLENADPRIWDRGWYFGGITVDPRDADVVYACDIALYRSTDGGATFVPFKGAPGGDDYHALWIDPSDSRRMIVASDQGAVVTVDGGKTWSSWYNQPTAQLYHVATDDRFPYRIYGAQQDTGAVATPMRTDYRSITMRDWNGISVGGESGTIVPDPRDADIVWGGTVSRFDWKTLQDRDLDPTLAHPGDYRSAWTLPLAISPRDPQAVYFARQVLFKTVDGGEHWERISPDLTREAPGVPASLDAETAADTAVPGPRRGVIYSIALSPLADGRIWCGTDDGLIWLSRDDGRTWRNVTPGPLGPWSKVGTLEASHFDAETAYAAIDRHRLDDVSAEILRTRDGGRTWESVARGIPEGSFVNVVREDPVRRGLLYAGTETGVFVSFDDGGSWQPLRLNLPTCSVRDIDVRHGDLVVATHGRSFWVLDDISPLRQIDAFLGGKGLALLAPRDAVRLKPAPFQGTPEPKDEPMAENPPAGAVIDYWLGSAAGRLTLEILDAGGGVVRRYASDDEAPAPDLRTLRTTADWETPQAPPSSAAGAHRFVWDLRAGLPAELAGPVRGYRRGAGPWAPPGRYTVRVTADGKAVTASLAVVKDPRVPASVTDADLVRQYRLAADLQDDRARVAAALRRAGVLRERIAALRPKAKGESVAALETLSRSIDRIAGPPETSPDEAHDAAPGGLRSLSASLAELQAAVESADAAPTEDMLAASAARRGAVAEALTRWRQLLEGELRETKDRLARAGLAPLEAE